jgi:hypothetical protein
MKPLQNPRYVILSASEGSGFSDFSTKERFFAPLLKGLRMTEKAFCNGLIKSSFGRIGLFG